MSGFVRNYEVLFWASDNKTTHHPVPSLNVWCILHTYLARPVFVSDWLCANTMSQVHMLSPDLQETRSCFIVLPLPRTQTIDFLPQHFTFRHLVGFYPKQLIIQVQALHFIRMFYHYKLRLIETKIKVFMCLV